MAVKLKALSRNGMAWFLVLALAPVTARAAGGRHVAPTDQAPAGQQGAVQTGYGRATIYRAGEPPKPADHPAAEVKSETVRAPRPANVDSQEAPLPVIIQGVPHRFRLHYSQTAC
ncbi:MAG TPA: hypothetical protein VFW87_03785 [Pirellulales bacterium]|nr:hypothetical protein [Pirellulales bacterium]